MSLSFYIPLRSTVPAPGGSLHNCVHQSVFCSGSAAPTVVAPPPGPERSLCWEQHSKLLAQFDLVSGAVVASWSVTQVATFVCSLPGCQAVAKIFRDEVGLLMTNCFASL